MERLRFVAVLAVLAMLAACTSSTSDTTAGAGEDVSTTVEGGTGSEGDEGSEGEGEGPTGMLISAAPTLAGAGQDPLIATAFSHKVYWDEIHDYLIEQEPNGNLVGALAESWEASEDQLTWTFKIREGVLFHNGDELTAEDVAWSLDRSTFDPESASGLSSRAQAIDSIEAVDTYTVEVTTLAPQATLPTWFGKHDGGSAATIYSKAHYESVGDEAWQSQPMGTGPYEFVSYEREQSADLTAFLDPNRNDWQISRTPHYKDLRVIAVPDASTRVALLRTGEVDLAPIPISSAEQLVDAEGVALIDVEAGTQSTMFCIGYTFNPESPCDDQRVREALSIAIDRQAIADGLYQGFAQPAAAYMAGPGAFGNPEDLEPPPYDPERAEQLLSEAGYDASNPLEIVIMASDIPGDFEMMPTLAESIAGYYDQIGVVASLRIEEEEAYKDALFEFQLPGHPGLPAEPATLWMRGVDNRWYFVDEQLSGFSSLGRSGAAVYNEEVYPDIRQRLDEVSAEFDFDLQAEKFAEFHRWMAGEWNQIQLLVGDAVYGASDKVGSWDQRIAGKAYAHNHWSIAP